MSNAELQLRVLARILDKVLTIPGVAEFDEDSALVHEAEEAAAGAEEFEGIDEMPTGEARRLAALWRDNKLVGGDAHAAAVALLKALDSNERGDERRHYICVCPDCVKSRADEAYYKAKLAKVMPLFEEARDALTAITEQQRLARGISKTLADRMDAAGTWTYNDWRKERGG